MVGWRYYRRVTIIGTRLAMGTFSVDPSKNHGRLAACVINALIQINPIRNKLMNCSVFYIIERVIQRVDNKTLPTRLSCNQIIALLPLSFGLVEI